MPIKFPKFTRRKSAGNSLEAAYEPANAGNHFQAALDVDEHDTARDSVGSTHGGFRVHARPDRHSGNTTGSGFSGPEYYAGSNRLSSISTIPSADSPRTPDEYRPQLPSTTGAAGFYSQSNLGKPMRSSLTFNVASNTPPSPRSRSPGGHFVSSPRRNTFNVAPPPRLDTTLDTSSLFGDEMFDFSDSKSLDRNEDAKVTPTAPRIAANPIISTDDNHYGIPPIPPPKSYDPAASLTTTRLPGNSNPAYVSPYAAVQHTDDDRPLPRSEYTPYKWNPVAEEQATRSNPPLTSRNLTPGQSMPRPRHGREDSLTAPPNKLNQASRQNVAKRENGDAMGLKRHSAVTRRMSIPLADEDAVIVANANVSKHGYEQNGQRQRSGHPTSPPSSDPVKRLSDKVKDRDSGWEESASSSGSSLRDASSLGSKETTTTSPAVSRGNTEPYVKRIESNNTTPKAKKTELVGIELHDKEDVTDLDSTMSMAAALVAQYEQSSPNLSQPPPPKVMTRAQFELYQQQQDDQRRLSGKTDESDKESNSSESDDEESETERTRMQAKQRAKQDAHLAVYRQQMMKITGTEPSEYPLGMQYGPASVSMSALPMMTTSGPGSSGKDSEEEEDEEVPLGILMAHGFPNKHRPPTRLTNASSQPNLRATAQSQLQDPRLPPFARNLPVDPYNIGASIVNPMNRMSLAFGGGSDTRSNAGGSQYNSMPPSEMPGRHAQGLVGEIMKAEEMKAARKGHMQYTPQKDPFRPDPFGRSSSPANGLPFQNGGLPLITGGGMAGTGAELGGQGLVGGIPNHGGLMASQGMSQGAPAQGDPFQAQMANQMQQMMQMQMQWMQIQMQNGQNPQQQLFPPGMMGSLQRPSTMASANNPQGIGLIPPHQRTMSMTRTPPQFPPMPQFPPGIHSGYAPSIGPQQGLSVSTPLAGPQGYAPSIAPSERSTVGLPSRYRPVSNAPGSASSGGVRTPTLTSAGADWSRNKTPGPSHLKNNAADSDDDDDDGWEQLNKKRQEKSGWRKQKDESLKGMLNFGTTANPTV